MGERVIQEITLADYPGRITMLGRCGVAGCLEPPKKRVDRTPGDCVNFLRGWFERHVLETGHSILIVEPSGDAGALRGTGAETSSPLRPTVGESA